MGQNLRVARQIKTVQGKAIHYQARDRAGLESEAESITLAISSPRYFGNSCHDMFITHYFHALNVYAQVAGPSEPIAVGLQQVGAKTRSRD
jgi:hypothetical protein